METGAWPVGGRQAARARERAERERRWREHLAAWQRSGLNQAEYCRRRVLKPADFSWWKQELARRDQRGLAGRARIGGELDAGAGRRDAVSRRGVRAMPAMRNKHSPVAGAAALVAGIRNSQGQAPLARAQSAVRGTPEPSAEVSAFLPVRVTAPLCAYPYEVSLRSGHVLRLGDAFVPENVRALIALLEGGAPC